MQSAVQRTWLAIPRLIRRLFLLCAAVYVLFCALVAVFQRSLLYLPSVYTREQVDQMAQSAHLERWTNSAGGIIGMRRLSPRQPAEGTVLITYGNGGTAIGSEHYATEIQSIAALDVCILEYPGYEDRPGPSTQKNLFRAADEALQSLSTNGPVYLVGESLGTGVASYLAGTHSDRIAGILLISPFNSLTDAARIHYPLLPVGLLLMDRYPSEKYLRYYHGNVGVTVDTRDEVVPERLGLGLYTGYIGPKKLWEFPDGGHCQIDKPPTVFWREIVEFWRMPPEK